MSHTENRSQVGLRVSGFAAVAENATKVANFGGSSDVSRPLRARYFDSLCSIQPVPFPWSDRGVLPTLDFGETEAGRLLYREIAVSDAPVDDWAYSSDDVARIRELCARSFDMLRSANIELPEAVGLAIGGLVFGRKPGFGGGSTSDILGALWLAPETDASVQEFSEMLYHEYVHQTLFLDEMVNTLFSVRVPAMAHGDGLVTSAILRRKRGYDKSFHSAYVAYSLISLRDALGWDYEGPGTIEDIRVTVAEMNAKPQFLTSNGLRLLRELSDAVGL